MLLHLLETQFNVRIDADELAATLELNATFDPAPVLEQVEKLCTDVPEFTTTTRAIIGTFSYAKLPMVHDIKAMSENGLLAEPTTCSQRIAGDDWARAAVRSVMPGRRRGARRAGPDERPANEFLVLDADASQSYAINAAVGGGRTGHRGAARDRESQTIVEPDRHH